MLGVWVLKYGPIVRVFCHIVGSRQVSFYTEKVMCLKPDLIYFTRAAYE